VESSSTGLGIAVKNVHDRMLGYFGPNAEMVYTSQLGEGTQVTLRCPGCAKSQEASEAEASVLSELPEEENDVLKEGTYSVHREVSEVEGAPYAPLHGEDEEPRMGATADEADKLLAHVSS
jgi:hypothetical protein